jgi:hypothetical protein
MFNSHVADSLQSAKKQKLSHLW